MSRFKPSQLGELSDIAIDATWKGADKTGTKDSTQAIINAITAANGGHVYLPPGTYLITSTFTQTQLQGAHISGAGNATILKFTGNITAFDFSQCTDASLEDVLVQVDTTNTSDVIKIGNSSATTETSGVTVENVMIQCASKAQGQYTGVHFYTSTPLLWKNTFENVKIYNPSEGILLESVCLSSGQYSAITGNAFKHIYIEGMTSTGFETKQTQVNNGGTQISHNVYQDVIVRDTQNAATTRTGFIVAGDGDSYIGMRTFSDAAQGTFNALKFNPNLANVWTGQYNVLIGGIIEGLISNIQYKNVNIVDLLWVEQQNYNTVAQWGQYTKLQNDIQNVLKNSSFESGADFWTGNDTTAFVVGGDNTSPTGRSLQAQQTGTTATFQIYQAINPNYAYAGKNATFIACVKFTGYTTASSQPITAWIDEGAGGNNSQQFTPTGNWQIVSVDRTIVGANGDPLQVKLTIPDGLTNVEVDVAWTMFVVNGFARTTEYFKPAYISQAMASNTGSNTVAAGSTSVSFPTGLAFQPPSHKVRIVPTSSWGSASKYWITFPSYNQLQVNLDTAPGGSGFNFDWAIDP